MKNAFISLIFTALLITSVVSVGSAIAQNQNQSQSQNQSSMSTAAIPENQTMASISGGPKTIIANQTTVPAEQTSVTVNQTSEPVKGQPQIQPLEKQKLTSETGDLSNIQNKTMVKATGPADITIANKTIVPFNQTTVGTGNSTK